MSRERRCSHGTYPKKKTPRPSTSRRSTSARSSRSRSTALPPPEVLRQFVRSQAEDLLRDPNVTSIGIGYKEEDGKRTERICIQFTVGRKVPEREIEALGSASIPKFLTVAGVKVPTDVLQRDYMPDYEVLAPQSLSARKQRRDPLIPGISVSHPSGTAGTLGAVVFDTRDGATCMLSNWHVLHTDDGPLDEVVVQPGPFDDNQVGLNAAGRLRRSHLGLAGDCAIAAIEGRGTDPTILDLGQPVRRLARPELGDRLVKSGRTTEVTRAFVTRVDVTTKIDYGGTTGERLIGSFELEPDPEFPAPNDEISRGGDSGSAWMVVDKDGKATDIMAGLHFAGEGPANPHEHALACYAHAVFKKLEISPRPVDITVFAGTEVSRGYDVSFLATPVPLPALPPGVADDAFVLAGSPLLHYTHFSLVLSKARRLARYVAWNVDGGRLRKLSRKNLRFRNDPRVPDELQADNTFYKNNKLDRGHVARRADLLWGTEGVAKQANSDSFFFTNITPQHEAFNQSSRAGLWGELENAVFEGVEVEDLRLTVVGGPILKPSDPVHRGLLIPRSYWKLLVFRDGADGRTKAKAYVLTQDDLLNDIEALELDEFRLFQVSIPDLESRTGLSFAALHGLDELEICAPETHRPEGERRFVREVLGREGLI